MNVITEPQLTGSRYSELPLDSSTLSHVVTETVKVKTVSSALQTTKTTPKETKSHSFTKKSSLRDDPKGFTTPFIPHEPSPHQEKLPLIDPGLSRTAFDDIIPYLYTTNSGSIATHLTGQELYDKGPSFLHRLLKHVSPDYAYLLCLEADVPPIDQGLDSSIKKCIEEAHQYNQLPYKRRDDNETEWATLNELAPYLRKLEISSKKIRQLPPLPLCKTLHCANCTALEQLKELANCEELHCSHCNNLRILPELPNCIELFCSHCKQVELPSKLPKCLILFCTHCSTLKVLPELPMCQTLNCSNCKNLVALPQLLHCQELDCESCPNLTKLPELLTCCELNCSQCLNLNTLPELLNCIQLNCSECIKLKELPTLLNCKTLNCKNCIKLTSLPELPKCNELTCSDCKKLKSIPKLPLCKTLYCLNCESLEKLSKLPKCRILSCAQCIHLTALPPLPCCTILFCEGCDMLIELPELIHCKRLDCRNCIALTTLPDILPCCTTFNYSGSLQIRVLPECPLLHASTKTLIVKKADLNTQPESVLLKLQKILKVSKQFPKITFIEDFDMESTGLDGGGLSREFVTLLTEKLVAESRDHPILHFLPTQNGYLPYLNEGSKEEIKCWQALGELLSAIYYSNDLLLGAIFDFTFFQAMAALTPSDFINEMTPELQMKIFCELQIPLFSEFTNNALASAMRKMIHRQNNQVTSLEMDLSLSEKEMESLYFLLYQDDLKDDDPKKIEAFKKQLNEETLNLLFPDCLKKFKMHIDTAFPAAQQQIDAILLIAQAMAKRVSWSKLGLLNAVELCEKLQGVIDKKTLIEKLVFTGINHIETKKSLIEWIEQASQEQIKRFLQAISGSIGLAKNTFLKVILVNPRSSEQLPVASTCKFSLQLPINNQGQKAFNAKMHTFLEYAYGFGLV